DERAVVRERHVPTSQRLACAHRVQAWRVEAPWHWRPDDLDFAGATLRGQRPREPAYRAGWWPAHRLRLPGRQTMRRARFGAKVIQPDYPPQHRRLPNAGRRGDAVDVPRGDFPRQP